MFKNIVLATTPREVCQCASDLALALARRDNARLNIFYAAGVPEYGWGAVRHLAPSGELDAIRAEIEEFYAGKTNGVDWTVHVAPGLPQAEVLRLARKQGADLICMGPSTRTNTQDRRRLWGMLGSTVQKVASKARCPVLVASRQVPEDFSGFRRIIASTDFSDQAGYAVDYACRLARHENAELVVLHVLDAGTGVEPPAWFGQDVQQALDKAAGRLEQEYGPRLSGDNYRFAVVEGQPHQEILKAARNEQADLIVMAHHSRCGDPEQAVAGSTTARVALTPSCPVLSVNRAGESCAAPAD